MPVSENNFAVLSSRYGINAMVNYFNGELGNDINDVVVQEFYNQYILDAMELASENYIFTSYAKPYYVPEGYASKKLKRYGGLTEHTSPLPEGIPPKSDKTKVTHFEATFNQYGRFMEFTDRVNYMAIDPIIAMYSGKYGELAARTKERLAKNELLHSTSILVPQSAGNGTADLAHMTLHDALTYNDYRVMVAKMKRMLVKPVEGNNFHLIGSPEVKFDLFTDQMVRDYFGAMAGITAYASNELPVLFNIVFKENMLDDYQFGYELANPGEIDTVTVSNGTTTFGKVLRIYTKVSDVEYYLNVPETYRKVKEARLLDGSYIPEKVEWDVTTFLGTITEGTVCDKYNPAGTPKLTIGFELTSALATTLKGNTVVWKQLPLHKCILLGDEALIETGIEGHTAPKIYTKALGSAGVLDPIDQRQSVGFKIDTIGYALLKPEACVVCYTIPSMAEEINTTMYTYNSGVISMNTHSYAIPNVGIGNYAKGAEYKQTQTRDGYNQYGKLNDKGNVDMNRPANVVPGVQAPFFTGMDEFGATPVNTNGVITQTDSTEGNNPNKK